MDDGEHLLAEYADTIRDVALRMARLCRVDPEDAHQEALLGVWLAAGSVDRTWNVDGLVHRIVQRRIIDYARRTGHATSRRRRRETLGKRRDAAESVDHMGGAAVVDEEARLEARESIERLFALAAELGERHALVAKHRVGGKTLHRIGRRLGVSEARVCQIWRRVVHRTIEEGGEV